MSGHLHLGILEYGLIACTRFVGNETLRLLQEHDPATPLMVYARTPPRNSLFAARTRARPRACMYCTVVLGVQPGSRYGYTSKTMVLALLLVVLVHGLPRACSSNLLYAAHRYLAWNNVITRGPGS